MIKRLVLVAVVLAILVPFVLDRMKSDEDRIRDLITGQIEAFGEGSVSGVIDPLAIDFSVKGRAIKNRGEARDIMTVVSREARSEVGFNLVLEEKSPEIRIDLDGDQASAQLQLALHRRVKGKREELWVFGLELELEREDGGDWQVQSAVVETLSGRPGF